VPQIVAATIAVAVSAATQGSSTAPQDAWLQRVIDRGKALYLYDRAAWVTSDDATVRIPSDRQSEVGGWVVTSTPIGFHVDYFGKDAAEDHVVYSADVIAGKVTNATVFPTSSEPVLKEPALQMAHALRAARFEAIRHADWHPCSSAPFNSVVLPPQSDGTVPVYFLTPQTDLNNFPFGGHYEVDIASNGTTAYTRSFTNSCVTLSKPPSTAGGIPAALYVTHLLDAHPTEIHVFEQYNIGLPVFVGTGLKSAWEVKDGTIEDVSAMMPK
jgi:hypothetical protein